MQHTDYAVTRLTEAHTVTIDGHLIDWPPLLTWLETSVTEVMGRSGGSGGGTGLPFNTEALALLKHIDTRLNLITEAIGDAGGLNRLERVIATWLHAKDERAGGRIDDAQWESICAEFPEWVARIEAEDDRPHKMELTTPCPRCEKRWVVDNVGDRTAAVWVTIKPGQVPVAECRTLGCGAIWAGWNAVAQLGLTVGAHQDQAVLAACGINLKIGTTNM